MAKRSKFLIALGGLIAGITIGVLWVSFNQQDFISEDDARALVNERYGGSVESVSLSEDDRYFIINLKGSSATHSITVDREDSSVQGIKTVAQNDEPEPAEEPAAENTEKSKAENNDEQKEKTDETPEQTSLTVEEATDIALAEVGGTTVYSTWSGEDNTKEYYILQLLNDDDEGALVSINSITGKVNKVIWLEIDEDYEEIERLVYEAAEYANLYDSRYIEYDDEYFEE